MHLSETEKSRYSRHIMLNQVGEKGQLKLKSSAVLVIGAGGLGSSALNYLTAAGIGHIGIVDFDEVDLSNLQRQTIHNEYSLGTNKAKSAKENLEKLNSQVQIKIHTTKITEKNIIALVESYDVVLDCTDNYTSRYLINDACHFKAVPLISGTVFQFEGQLAVFNLPNGPCYRCLYPEAPPSGLIGSCNEAGVFGTAPGIIGTFQANECIKILLGLPKQITNSFRLHLFNFMNMNFKNFEIHKDENCALCSQSPSIKQIKPIIQACMYNEISEITPIELSKRFKIKNNFTLIDIRSPEEANYNSLPNALNIPLDSLSDKFNFLKHKLKQKEEIILYCKSGVRSKKAANILKENNIKGVISLEGGIDAWEQSFTQSSL